MHTTRKSLLFTLLAIVMILSLFLTNDTPLSLPSLFPDDKDEDVAPKTPTVINDIDYKELGQPLLPYYAEMTRSTVSCDMIIWDGKLFVGGGDYDTNTGPVPIMCYDPELNEWSDTGSVQDEQVNRFCVIDGKLTVPGTDPMDEWDFGNYYYFEDGEWKTSRTIPNGIHNFDMVKFDGKIFAGLGVSDGYNPIVSSEDGGESFAPVFMYKDGNTVDTFGKTYTRVYDLTICNGRLYAFYSYHIGEQKTIELYSYNKEKNIFEFTSDVSSSLKVTRINYNLINSKINVGKKLYLATGSLYCTEDMLSFTEIPLAEGGIVCDLYENGGNVYALCGAVEKENQYRISVWKLVDGEFLETFNFLYDAPPMSLAFCGGEFYIGVGNYSAENEKNGTVLSVCIK